MAATLRRAGAVLQQTTSDSFGRVKIDGESLLFGYTSPGLWNCASGAGYLQNARAFAVHSPMPLATICVMTAQT